MKQRKIAWVFSQLQYIWNGNVFTRYRMSPDIKALLIVWLHHIHQNLFQCITLTKIDFLCQLCITFYLVVDQSVLYFGYVLTSIHVQLVHVQFSMLSHVLFNIWINVCILWI